MFKDFTKDFNKFLNPITNVWKNANRKYNKAFHRDDTIKTDQDSLAHIAVGVGAGLGVGVGIIALAPVIGVSVGGALGIGAVCLTTTAIGAGIGVAIGFIPENNHQEHGEKAKQNTSRTPHSQEGNQTYTQREVSVALTPTSPDASSKPAETKNGTDNGVAGVRSTQDSQQATASTITNNSKVAGAVTEILQATPNKEDATYKSSVATSSLFPSTQVRGVDNKTGEQEKLGVAHVPSSVAGGNSHQVLQKPLAVDLEISSPRLATKLTNGTKSSQKPDVTETPPGPDNSPALQSSPPPLDLVGDTDAPKPPSTSPANSATNTGANKSLTLAQGLDSGQANNP